MSLGNNLLNLRKKKGLSQEEVAEILNVSRQTVSKWETDQSLPDFDKIKPLCELYGITADELLFDKKEETKKEHNESNIDDNYSIKKKAALISTGILLYFISIVWTMISIPVIKLDPIISSGVFLLICGVATFLVAYANMVYKKKNKVTIETEEIRKSPLMRTIYATTTLIFTAIYLLISFATHKWSITWIIWIIYSITIEVIKLFSILLRGDNNEK